MALEAVIFDLDLTLIASAAAEALRRQRAWPEVYKLVPQLTPYEGVAALLASLAERNLKTAIVTSSPSSYCSRVVQHWKLPITTTVCFHDTTEKKPHPAPILKALEKMRVAPENTVAVGDMPADIASARAAKVFSIAALWGISTHDMLIQAKPDLVCATVQELVEYIDSRMQS